MKKRLLFLCFLAMMLSLSCKLFAQFPPNWMLITAKKSPQMQTVISGQYTAPIIWPGGPGCIHVWESENTSIGIQSGTGNVPSFQVRNISHDPIYIRIADTPMSLPAMAYIPSQISNRVAVVDIATNTVVKTIDVGHKPYGVAISHDGTRVYISNYTDGTVSVINALNNTIITTITTGKNPEGMAISLDDGAVYVANSGESTVSIINTVTNVVTGNFSTDPNPVDVAINKDGSQLYVAYANSNNLDLFKVQSHAKIAANLTPGIVKAMVLSPDGSNLYTLDPGVKTTGPGNQVYNVINTAANTASSYNVGAGLNGIALNADGSTLYLTSGTAAGLLSCINTSNNTLNKQITVGSNPNGVAVAPGGLVYVINQDSNDISVIDATASTVTSFKTGDLQLFAHGNFIRGTTCTGVATYDTLLRVFPSPPTIFALTTPGDVTTYADEASPSTSFNISALNLNEGILVTAPAGYEVSADNITFSKTITIGYGDNIDVTAVYVRLAAGNSPGTNDGTIVLSSDGAPSVNVPIHGTILKAIQNIKIGPVSGTIAFCGGNPSASPRLMQFKINGTLLTGDISIAAPANFEISLSPGSGYGTSLTLTNTIGTISNVSIFVRSAAAAPGNISGDIILKSPGAITRKVAVTGNAFAVPTVNPVPDQLVTGGFNLQQLTLQVQVIRLIG